MSSVRVRFDSSSVRFVSVKVWLEFGSVLEFDSSSVRFVGSVQLDSVRFEFGSAQVRSSLRCFGRFEFGSDRVRLGLSSVPLLFGSVRCEFGFG